MYFRHVHAAAKMIEMKWRSDDRRVPYNTIYVRKGYYDRTMAAIQPALRED